MSVAQTAADLRNKGLALLEESEALVRQAKVSAGEMLHKLAETYLNEADNIVWRLKHEAQEAERVAKENEK